VRDCERDARGLLDWSQAELAARSNLSESTRCDLPAPPEVKAITFDQSAQILAEVGKSLVDAGLIKDNKLEEIVWAVRTKYAQSLWERPPTQKECETPIVTAAARKRLGLPQSKTVVDFTIPPPRR
jgi:hypothetical protein